jgi:hypothetical protein
MICTALVSLPAKGEVGCTRDIFTKRQATLPDCLPNLLGDWDKDIEIVYCEENYFVLLYTTSPMNQGRICTL